MFGLSFKSKKTSGGSRHFSASRSGVLVWGAIFLVLLFAGLVVVDALVFSALFFETENEFVQTYSVPRLSRDIDEAIKLLDERAEKFSRVLSN